MIIDQALAARIERAEGEFIAACCRAVGARTGAPEFQVPVAGGFATYAGVDSPFNKIVGTGFQGLPTDDELARLEALYDEYGVAGGFEISTLAEPAIFELLTARGYLLIGFEDVLVSHLAVTGAGDPVDGIEVIGAEDQLGVWMDVAVESALHADTAGVPQLDSYPRTALQTAEQAGVDAGARPYLATIAGEAAGAGAIHLDGLIAQLTGAGTLPSFRRHGVQRELIRVRLAAARAAGCEYAVVTTQPGSTSQANMRRAGFELGYSRAVLTRHPST